MRAIGVKPTCAMLDLERDEQRHPAVGKAKHQAAAVSYKICSLCTASTSNWKRQRGDFRSALE
jgi:hypothetical protein